MTYQPCSLALGGGGLKGAAHVGVLKVFEEEGFPINCIAGTSVGAFVGALYAIGYTADDLIELLYQYSEKPPINFQVSPIKVFFILINSIFKRAKTNRKTSKNGLIDGGDFTKILRGLFKNKGFEDLHVPLLITAVDLQNGRLQVFTDRKMVRKLQGIHDLDLYSDVDLVTAVRASTAIPGIFTPVYYQNKVLVDGEVKNAVPADLLRMAGNKRIVAVDLTFTNQNSEQLEDVISVLLQTIDVMCAEVADLVIERYADFVIRPLLKDASLTDYHQLIEIYENGYKIAKRKVISLRRLLV